jgi:hypothetical protein
MHLLYYRYFGAAKDLPGVRELFAAEGEFAIVAFIASKTKNETSLSWLVCVMR